MKKSKRTSGITQVLWHYTIAAYLESIIKDGFIYPATAGVPKGERPIVWLSSNMLWEQTANKGGASSMEETAQVGGGLVRIGVQPETALPWLKLKRLSRMQEWMATALVRSAKEMGANPFEWWGTFTPVSQSKWTAIETWSNGSWASLN